MENIVPTDSELHLNIFNDDARKILFMVDIAHHEKKPIQLITIDILENDTSMDDMPSITINQAKILVAYLQSIIEMYK